MTTHWARLAARPSQSNLRGSEPEVLKRERGHVTSKSGVSPRWGSLGHSRQMGITDTTGVPDGCTIWLSCGLMRLNITIFTRGQFCPLGIVIAFVCVCVSVSVCVSITACLRDNSGPIQARVIKFGPKVQNNLVRMPIVLWGDWPWPSRSNIRSESKFTPFWACPHYNSSSIQAGITKFGPEVQNTSVRILIVL